MKQTFITTTAQFQYRKTHFLSHQKGEVVIPVSPDRKKQKIMGFGGAFTEASAHLYHGLSDSDKKEFIRLYFSKDGLNYRLGRTTIGSCDFSLGEYDYSLGKPGLKDFSLKHDEEEILPLLHDAFEEHPLTLLASSWSPLACFKDNQDKKHGGRILPEYASRYADYLSLYVREMEKHGFPISMMTIQNEPEATQTWESCRFTEEEEYHLASLLHERLPDVALYGWDHNRDVMVRRAENLFHQETEKEVFQGIAYHWYDSGCSSEIGRLRKEYPDKHILFTEGCVELLNLSKDDPSSCIGRFQSAVRYFRNYLLDARYGSEGFIDWNLLLDQNGGPNHVGNFCEAPVMLDEKGHLSLKPSYTAIRHFSANIQPGAYVLETEDVPNLLLCAFLNPDQSIVVEMMTDSDEKCVTININDRNYTVALKKNMIATLVIRQK